VPTALPQLRRAQPISWLVPQRCQTQGFREGAALATVANMGEPTRGATRLARAAAFGVAVLTIAVGAHVSAGGALPSMTVLAVLSLPLMMAAVVLTSRRCGLALLLGSMAAAQVLLHPTLMALAAQVPGDMSDQMGAASASAMGGQAMAPIDGRSVTMTSAHVIATVVTTLLLARGEQALWQLVSRLLPALPSEPTVVGCGPLQAPAPASAPALAPSLVSGGLGLRGPPVRVVAAD
jgi:hypothetical protein